MSTRLNRTLRLNIFHYAWPGLSAPRAKFECMRSIDSRVKVWEARVAVLGVLQNLQLCTMLYVFGNELETLLRLPRICEVFWFAMGSFESFFPLLCVLPIRSFFGSALFNLLQYVCEIGEAVNIFESAIHLNDCDKFSWYLIIFAITWGLCISESQIESNYVRSDACPLSSTEFQTLAIA